MLEDLPNLRRMAVSLPAAVPGGALLRPFSPNGILGIYYYALAGSRAVAVR
jgi:hypothetical protein